MVNRREQPLQKFQSFIADRHSVGDGDLMDDFVDAVGGEALVFYFLEGWEDYGFECFVREGGFDAFQSDAEG